MNTGRFDVVVVGTRARGSQAVVDLAVAVGRVTGLAPGAVQRGLEGGEVVVHAGLSKTEAVVAARTVQQLGAIVDVRPARTDDGGLRIEPDGDAAALPVEAATPTAEPAPGPARPAIPEPPVNPAGALLDPHAPALNLGGRPVASRFAPPVSQSAKLELDFAGAGLEAPPPGTSALFRGPSASQASGVAVRSSGSFAAIDPAASMRAPVSGAHVRVPTPGLLAHDRVASALFGTAIAAAFGMLVAFAFVRGDAKAVADRLEPELRDAIADPLGVEAGRRRAPATIVAEIDDVFADVRTTYLLVWAAIALPLGALAGLLKRPS